MKMRTVPNATPGRRQAGFTAIEITAVVTIIALMALILIPIMRGQVEDAKKVAAQDDMASIEKAEMIANAETGKYYRLFDLSKPGANQEVMRGGNAADIAIERRKVPQGFWDRRAFTTEITALTSTWKSSQLAIHRSIALSDLIAQSPFLFRGDYSSGGVSVSGRQGPILVLQADDADQLGTSGGVTRLKYPVDPWGGPYLFFGPGKLIDNTFPTAVASGNETDFGTAVIYCMGPDGFPGSLPTVQPIHYFRETSVLGTPGSDDLVREF